MTTSTTTIPYIPHHTIHHTTTMIPYSNLTQPYHNYNTTPKTTTTKGTPGDDPHEAGRVGVDDLHGRPLPPSQPRQERLAQLPLKLSRPTSEGHLGRAFEGQGSEEVRGHRGIMEEVLIPYSRYSYQKVPNVTSVLPQQMCRLVAGIRPPTPRITQFTDEFEFTPGLLKCSDV